MMANYVTIGNDWQRIAAAWDDARKARHAAHTARWLACGWRADSSSYLAYEDVLREDNEAREAQR